MADTLTEHITDPEIRAFYDALEDRSNYASLMEGERLLKTTTDRLAILEMMRKLIEWILSDFGEHGNANKTLHGDKPKAFFIKRAATIEKQIAKERSEGRDSTICAQWQRTYDERMKTYVAADDAAEEREIALGKEVVTGLQASLSDVDGFLLHFNRLEGIPYVRQDIALVIAQLLNNAILAQAKAGNMPSAQKLVRAYVQLHELFRDISKAMSDELLANVLCGLDGDSHLRNDVLKLVGDIRHITSPRLAFNLACAQCKAGRIDDCLATIKAALALGKPRESFRQEADFTSIRADTRFRRLVQD